MSRSWIFGSVAGAVLVWTMVSLATGQTVVEMTMNDARPTSDDALPSQRNFSFASYYGDHMVLQQAPRRAVVWGYSPDVGDTVKVKVGDYPVVMTTVYNDSRYGVGVWKVKLPSVSQPGPFVVTATSSTESISLTDVLFGDVWLCSGQSNMVFTVGKMYEAIKELANGPLYPNIRVFDVAQDDASNETLDILKLGESWSLPSNVSLNETNYFSAVCWLFGKYLNQEYGFPVGLIDTSYGGTPIEAWSSTDALGRCGLQQLGTIYQDPEKTGFESPYDHSTLWNCMVHPLLNMTIYGVLWYQGENNAMPGANTHKYNCTFPTMIDDWRNKFHEGSLGETDTSFPFGFVQLGPKDPVNPTSGFPEIRWHQTADYGYVPNPRMKNVFMAVGMDLTDFASTYHSVHYRDKTDVGKRLFLSGLKTAYHQDVFCNGPLPTDILENEDTITLNYNDSLAYDNYEGFEVLCVLPSALSPGTEVTWWEPTPVINHLTTRIDLLATVCGQGQTIHGLRYNWKESPCAFKMCSVYSARNLLLPAPPFISYEVMTGVKGTRHVLDWTTPTHIRD